MMTNRSNHIPMFTKMLTMKTKSIFSRSFLNQNRCGQITLQEIMLQ